MSLLEVKKDFTRRELLWFGPLFALFVALIGVLVIRPAFPLAAYVLWGVSGVLIAIYYLVPAIRRPVYLGWLYAVFPIGWVVSHVLLGIIFYLVLTPIGLLMRVVRYDPMKRKFESQATTYWVKRDINSDRNRYFKQY